MGWRLVYIYRKECLRIVSRITRVLSDQVFTRDFKQKNDFNQNDPHVMELFLDEEYGPWIIISHAPQIITPGIVWEEAMGWNAHLEVLAQVVHLSTVFTADPLAARTAVTRVVAHVDAGGGQRSALCPRAHRSLRRALTLRAVLRVQEVPLTHVVDRAVSLTCAVLPCHWEAKDARRTEQKGTD